MGTLGCVNDMQQRDKQNRELRKISRNRMKDTYHRLLQLDRHTAATPVSPEKMDEIRKGISRKEEEDACHRLNAMWRILTVLITLLVLGWLAVRLFV